MTDSAAQTAEMASGLALRRPLFGWLLFWRLVSVALVCGFLVNMLSVLDSNATQGILLAVSIVVALLADFFFMPALVLTFHPFGPEGQRASGELRKAA